MKLTFCSGLFIALVLVTTFFSCDEEDKVAIERSASTFDIEQGRASIQRSNIKFMKAFEAGDSTEVANCFTKEAVILIDDGPSIEGKDNIEHFFSQIMKKDIAKYELETKNVWGDSSILVEEGRYELTAAKKQIIEKGRYLVLWKQEAGNWKIFRDIWARDFPSNALVPLKDSTAAEPSKKRPGFL